MGRFHNAEGCSRILRRIHARSLHLSAGENSIILVGGANKSDEWQITDEATQVRKKVASIDELDLMEAALSVLFVPDLKRFIHLLECF